MRKHKVLTRTIAALEGGVTYTPELEGVLVFTDKNGNERRYGVKVYGEHDGVWIVKHSRPSGRWNRAHRVVHATTATEHVSA